MEVIEALELSRLGGVLWVGEKDGNPHDALKMVPAIHKPSLKCVQQDVMASEEGIS